MKRGFTLVELLATLVLVGIISGLSLASLNRQVKKTDNSSYNEFISTVKLSVDSYITSKKDYYPELSVVNNTACINLTDVVLAGYLTSKTKNPETDVTVVRSAVMVTLSSSGEFIYQYLDNQQCSM